MKSFIAKAYVVVFILSGFVGFSVWAIYETGRYSERSRARRSQVPRGKGSEEVSTDTRKVLCEKPIGVTDEQWGEVQKVWERLLCGDAPPFEAVDFVMELMPTEREGAITLLRGAASVRLYETQPDEYWECSAPRMIEAIAWGNMEPVIWWLKQVTKYSMAYKSVWEKWKEWLDEAAKILDIVIALKTL